MTIEKLISKYQKFAEKHGKEPESIKWLIMELSFYTPSEFYLHLRDEANVSFVEMIEEAVNKYVLESIPVQHILGFSYFYGYKFKVNDQVLIPRRETEELVEEILSLYDQYFDSKKVDVLDLGTGSGCIGVTLSLEESNMVVDGTDISKEALIVAKENNHQLGANANLFISDWFSMITKKYDIIVANPPYIPDGESVQDIVSKEPNLALFGGLDGLKPYEIILSHASKFLKEKAIIAFEHSMYQKDEIKALVLKYFKDANVYQKKDMQGKDRMTFVGIGGIF